MKLLFIAVNVLILVLLGWLFWPKPTPLVPKSFESKTVNLGNVEVAATPLTVKDGEALVFRLIFTTHSVDLNYEFTQIISAGDDLGNVYPAANWSGGRGGHHLSGNLTLTPLKPKAKAIRLIFTNIDGKGGELLWQL